jgi:hypothetical protein
MRARFHFGFFFLAIIIVAGILADVYYDPASSTLPLRDPHAMYMVERTQTSAVKNDKGIVSVPNYILTYKTSWLGSEVTGSVLIGKSAVELAPYAGKRARFQGSVNYAATQQCIKDQCHLLFGGLQKATAVDIASLTGF